MDATGNVAVLQPTADVSCWLEQESSVMLKAVTRFGDPVELSADDARIVGSLLLELAAKLEPDNKTDKER